MSTGRRDEAADPGQGRASTSPGPTSAAGPGAWLRELMLGARLALTGGREAWIRTTLTVVGVSLGVAMLLAAAAIPNMLHERSKRLVARDAVLIGAQELPKTATTVLVETAETTFRGNTVAGRLVQADGPSPVLPPGVTKLPRPGEMLVSPALKDLLESAEGQLLRPRLPYRTTGTIDEQGLSGPREYIYIAGADDLATSPEAVRIDHFGDGSPSEGLDPVLMLLVVIMLVVLLLPIGVFVASAVRFGSEQRDRRLAALRLVGADSGMTRRIAAGEAAIGAVGGVLVSGLFFLIGREFIVERVSLQGVSVFASDVRPNPVLLLLTVLAVPVAAVGITVMSLRRVVVEPLGVVRRASAVRARRLWWRLLMPVAGLALLYPLIGDVDAQGGEINGYLVAAGVILLLVGVTAVLPWLVETVVRRFGGGGAVPWQLAVRRLQLDVAGSTRMINGIAVAAAGGIALQMLFGAIDQNYLEATGQDPTRAQVTVGFSQVPVATADQVKQQLAAVPGIRSLLVQTNVYGIELARDGKVPSQDDRVTRRIIVGDCATLRELATLDRCADGDTFFAHDPTTTDEAPPVRPGTELVISDEDTPAADALRWNVPKTVREVTARVNPVGWYESGLLVTPAVIDTTRLKDTYLSVYLKVNEARPDVYEHIRNSSASLDRHASVQLLSSTLEKPRFATIRRGLFIGVVAILLLIGASLLVTMLEQLRERRRVLAVLVAFGTRRGTLLWSVLWQTAIPVFLGLLLAIAAGMGLGAVLLKMVGEAIRINWVAIAQMTTAGTAVVLLVTLLSMPALWRMMRPAGLRSE